MTGLEIAAMIFGTCVSILISMLMAAATFFILMRLQTWYSLLMTVGAIFSLLIRLAEVTIGYLQTIQVISLEAYQQSSSFTYALRMTGNLCFAVGFVMVGAYLYRRLAPALRGGPTEV